MKATNIISILRLYIEFMRKRYPEITDDMLCTEDTDENIFYMNGNDETPFDFAVNNRLCEFMLFYKSTSLGFIKIFISTDDYIQGYLYLEEGHGTPIKFQKVPLSQGSALLLATLMNLQADKKGLYDRSIDKINLDYNVEVGDCYNFIPECECI